jgi:hypothetical protein
MPGQVVRCPVYRSTSTGTTPNAGASKPGPLVLPKAHAHNDYRHKHPLFDALDNGFCSVEADIHLVDGKLLVAHDRSAVKPERTLQALYLDPLRKRIQANGGRVYPGGPEVNLLIDLKQDWKTIYPTLRKVLVEYADILTTYSKDKVNTNAVAVIVTGDRSPQMFARETTRYAALDGTLDYLGSNLSPESVPWISSNWSQTFEWAGRGEFPANEKAKLKEIVNKAHAKGRRVRFWGSPDRPEFWTEMLREGVDLINTDDLPGLQRFFRERAN